MFQTHPQESVVRTALRIFWCDNLSFQSLSHRSTIVSAKVVNFRIPCALSIGFKKIQMINFSLFCKENPHYYVFSLQNKTIVSHE